jgi:hypothetical protein
MPKLTDSTFDIARPTGQCAATGAPIQPGEPFIAVLVEHDPEGSLQRLDYSIPGWDSGHRPAAPIFGHWRSIMQEPDASRRPFIDDDAMADLLEQLEGSQEPSRQSFRYVLALMLVRKRLFRFEGSGRDEQGRQVMRLRRASAAGAVTNDVLTIIDPGMDEPAIAAAIDQLSGVMAGE